VGEENRRFADQRQGERLQGCARPGALLDILPKDRSARKFLKRIRLSFNTDNGDLRAFEIAFRDGSALRNEFSNIRVNRKLDSSIFDFDFSGYTVTDG
jgi:outer membrane lipoprotein-sorting protein